jgi:3-oxoadipate enol-lactonase
MAAIDVAFTVAGSGPPLYFVHGIGSRKEMWRPIVDELADSYTCVAYDLRGHGQSPIPPTPYTLDDLVDDLEALRERLGHESIHIAGHSLGGQIGPAFAHRYPTRAGSIALLSTAAGRTADDGERVRGVIAKMRVSGIEAVLPTLVDRWYTELFADANPDIIAARIDQVMTTPADVFLSVFDIYAETEMSPWLHDVTSPCLVLTGENDPGCSPRLNRIIHGRLRNSELVILPNLRHSIIVEAPDLVTDNLRDFLGKTVGGVAEVRQASDHL